MMANKKMRAGLLSLVLFLSTGSLSQLRASSASTSFHPFPQTQSISGFGVSSPFGVLVRRSVSGRINCTGATPTEALRIRSREGSAQPLAPEPTTQQTGLRIILRGTPQLQQFPQALAAFQLAASIWEARIQTIETIVIDVDYGPTIFGTEPDSDVVAIVDTQALSGNVLYPSIRDRMLSGPYSSDARSFYSTLPAGSVVTDEGPTTAIASTSASLRALDLINPTADPISETADFGPPPAIGINSRFPFNFDSGDGVDSGEFDFDSIALHEIGHVLGFASAAGLRELNLTADVRPSTFDLFRLRPDASTGSFSTAMRIQSSGGDQVLFDGNSSKSLSTAKADGTGGDARQASHWKDDSLSGQYIGIMDPTIGPGERQFITDDDLDAFSAIGYRTRSLEDATVVVPLHSGLPQPGAILAPPPGFGVLSHGQYSIIVPHGASSLTLELNGNQDVDLYVRYGRPVVNQGHIVIADHRAATDSDSETLTLTGANTPPLRAGIYYLAIGNFGPGDADFSVKATVTGGSAGSPPAIFNLEPHLEGDNLSLECAASDIDGDISAAQISLLDDAGHAVKPATDALVDSKGSTRVITPLTITGLSGAPTARLASVILLDSGGNKSAEAVIDFSQAESGGLQLSNGSYAGTKLKMKAKGSTSNLQVEINGHLLGPSQKIKLNGSGTKLTIKGTTSQLGLQTGPNRVRVKNSSGWSNILIVTVS